MIELLAQAAPPTDDAALIWGFVLLGTAIVLLFIELFVPSGGIIAICSAVAVFASLAAFFMHSASAGMIALALYIVLGPAFLWFGFKWWAASSMGRRLVLGAENDPVDQTPEEAFAASNAAQRERASYLDELLHLDGVAETPLRPVGTVRLENGDRHEALAENGFIEADTKVRVVAVHDNQLKVRPC